MQFAYSGHEKKEINTRIERWVLELQNYDYTTEHREGRRMTHADSLSRASCIHVIEDNFFEKNLALAQTKGGKIEAIAKRLERSEEKFFEARNGVVFRKRKDNLLFYVPIAMEKTCYSNITMRPDM